MKNELLQIQETSIEGFSYSFTKCLLDKLKSLKSEDRLYNIPIAEAEKEEETNPELSPIADSVLTLLTGQVHPANAFGRYVRPSELNPYMEMVEEVLAIFQIEK